MIKQIEKYGATVWADGEMDALRKKRCLCLNCEHSGSCNKAGNLYLMCKRNNLALAITRCPEWKNRINES